MELHAYSQWDYWQKKPITEVGGISSALCFSLQFVKTNQSGLEMVKDGWELLKFVFLNVLKSLILTQISIILGDMRFHNAYNIYHADFERFHIFKI